MREANKNPTDFLKKDIITSKVILHEVRESIDPTYHHDQLYFGNSGTQGIKLALTVCQIPILAFIEWKRSGFPDYDCIRPLDRTIKGNFSF